MRVGRLATEFSRVIGIFHENLETLRVLALCGQFLQKSIQVVSKRIRLA